MKKFYYRKLIRDEIPEIIEKNNGEYKTKKLEGEDFKKELKKKIVEEAKEVKDADEDEILKELSDVLQLIKSIAENEGISFKDVEKKQKQRKEEKGEFKKQLFLVWSSHSNEK